MPESKIPWWVEYRRQQFKLRQISIEEILRRSLKDIAKEYMENASLACLHQLANPRAAIKQRYVINYVQVMLLVAFCFMVGMTCYFTAYTLSSTFTSPLIVSMESTTYPIKEIDFPAVALCNVNRISRKALRAYAESVYPYVALHNESFNEVEWWIYQYGRLLDFSWNESLDTHPFMDIRSKYHISSRHIFKRMKMFAPKCEDAVLNCYWGGNEYNCTDLFTVRRTFKGHCCVFNYVLEYNAAGRPQSTIANVKRQVEPGFVGGLLLFIDPMIEDYAYPLHHIRGFDVFLFDPTVYLDPHVGRVSHRMLEANKMMYIELKSLKQVATDEVRKYPWRTRNCLFPDEDPIYKGRYSYSACLIHCRIKTVQSLCKCTPYFLPADINTTELCTMEKLRCLNKYKEKLFYIFPKTSDTEGLEMEVQDSLYCPECLPDCEFTKHFTKVSKMPLTLEGFREKELARKMLGDDNNANISFLAIYQTTSDGTLDRLDVVSYWFEILSNFGGFAGVVIGFSIISVAEIVYFFGVRFFQQCYVNYKRYR